MPRDAAALVQLWGKALALPCSLAGLALVSLYAQPQTPFRAGVNFVRVDVTPADKSGNFISDLTQHDFEISELGKPQTIDTFDKVMLDGGLLSRDHPPDIRNEDDERREAARADVRLFGLFLDDYHVSRESSLQARDILSRFIATDLGPSDLIELMTPTTPLTSAILTSNHEAVESQLEHFLGRKGNYDLADLANAAEENAFRACLSQPACIERIRNEVALSALEGFITHFSAYKDARKTMILVTEGFAGGLRDVELQELYTEANRGNISIYWIDPRRLNAWTMDGGQWLWDERCECLVFKPGIVTISDAVRAQDPLKALTLYTDGRTLITNDLLSAMKQIVRDMSGYYLLGYNSTLDAYDGRFHEISVHVKRPGVSVRARKGYWAYTRNDLAAATAPSRPPVLPDIRLAVNAIEAVEQAGDRRIWIGFEKGTIPGKTTVLLQRDPPGSAAAAPSPMDVTAVDANGTAFFRDRVVTSASFEAPAGALTIRMSMADPGARDAETEVIDVPDFDSRRQTLATPQVIRLPAGARAPGPTRESPIAARSFRRTDRVRVRVPVAAEQEGLAFEARLLNSTGDALRDIRLSRGPGAVECELPLVALAPSDYVLEISVKGQALRAYLGFRVN